ncbi:MAG: hypothetical protein ACOYN0_06070 [Phycisphaerales bacterium]
MSRARVVAAFVLAVSSCAFASDPWADRVVSYSAGFGAQVDYRTPSVVLGSPERITGENTPVGSFPGAVTPFNPAFGVDEILSVGAGGRVIVAFDEPVVDDPMNPFGLDLIVFGNAGFIDQSFSDPDVAVGTATPEGALFGRGRGSAVEVSANGTTWFPVSGSVDALFPTLGYLDLAGPYDLGPGSVQSDFTRPVDPGLSPGGMSFNQLVAAYDGSGGGTGFDISTTGLPSISFVRITNVSLVSAAFEVDAFADVSPIPAPGAGVLLALGFAAARRRR